MKKNIKNKYFKKYSSNNGQFNIYFFISIIVLAIVGLLILFSASSYLTIKFNLSRYYYVIRQGLFLAVGIAIMLFISKINYRFYYDYANILFIISIILLIMVYIPPFSSPVNGSRRFVKLGIPFMPSDFAKPIIVIFLAKYLVKNRKKMKNFIEGYLIPGGIIAIPFLLVFFQRDLSTSLVLLFSLGIVFLIGGFNKKFALITLLLGAIGILAVPFIMKDYQSHRILAFLNPEKYYDDLSWQVLNGLFAVTRGGALGQGFGKSIYKHGYLSTEVNNDMIFSVVCEEFGFVGASFLVLLVFFITYQMIKIALRTKNEFGKLVTIGIAMVYFIQSAINIGVSINLIPNTGITLPFVSNGGTSIIAFCIMFGIILNISRYNEIEKKEKIENIDKRF